MKIILFGGWLLLFLILFFFFIKVFYHFLMTLSNSKRKESKLVRVVPYLAFHGKFLTEDSLYHRDKFIKNLFALALVGIVFVIYSKWLEVS